ncbi:MAG: hypothetical protein ACRDOH_19560 [Streptosporangiaceae bacterium]
MTAIAATMQAFFTGRLIAQRRASPHTIAAYRVPRTCAVAVSSTHAGEPSLTGCASAACCLRRAGRR